MMLYTFVVFFSYVRTDMSSSPSPVAITVNSFNPDDLKALVDSTPFAEDAGFRIFLMQNIRTWSMGCRGPKDITMNNVVINVTYKNIPVSITFPGSLH